MCLYNKELDCIRGLMVLCKYNITIRHNEYDRCTTINWNEKCIFR